MCSNSSRTATSRAVGGRDSLINSLGGRVTFFLVEGGIFIVAKDAKLFTYKNRSI